MKNGRVDDRKSATRYRVLALGRNGVHKMFMSPTGVRSIYIKRTVNYLIYNIVLSARMFARYLKLRNLEM